MRIERFAIEEKVIGKDRHYDYNVGRVIVKKLITDYVIYDRLKKKEIIEVNTGNDELDKELAEAILTMLNVKCVGEYDD